MVIRKRHKTRKMRRTRVCGYGRVSGGHRKSGRRGGTGGAGRKDHHKIWYTVHGIGKTDVGFISHPMIPAPRAVNVGSLDEKAETLGSKEGNIYKIDLTSLKIGKLLGSGSISKKMEIIVNQASKHAISKVEEAGGKVILPDSDE